MNANLTVRSHRPEFLTPSDLNNGKLVAGRYRILEQIGEGGMGVVFKARDLSLNRIVAVKILNVFGMSQSDVIRFHREAKAASNIKHPNVVQVLDFGLMNSGQPYMIMEFVDGVPLSDVISNREFLPVELVLQLLEQICDGMTAVHKQGIVHRDLKSSNLMVVGLASQQPIIKVLDFGIAKLSETGQEKMHRVTLTGEIIGSPRYMSPEQARGERVDQRSDIYSLGCILYEMLTGCPLFEGESALATIGMHLNQPPRRLSDCGVVFSAELEELVASAVAKEKEERFTSMLTMSQAAVAVREKIELGEADAEETISMPRTSRKRKLRKVSCLQTVAGGLLAFTLLHSFTQIATNEGVLASSNDVSSAQENSRLRHKESHPEIPKDKNSPNWLAAKSHKYAQLLNSLHPVKGGWSKSMKAEAPLTLLEGLEPENKLDLIGHTDEFLSCNGGLILVSNESMFKLVDSSYERQRSVAIVKIQKCTIDMARLRKILALRPINLELSSCQITDEHLRAIAECKTIQSLSCDNNPAITSAGLNHLKHLPELTALSLSSCELGNEQARVLSTLTQLCWLNVSGNEKITRLGLSHLLKGKGHPQLNLAGCACALMPVSQVKDLQRQYRKKISLNTTDDGHTEMVNELLKRSDFDFAKDLIF